MQNDLLFKYIIIFPVRLCRFYFHVLCVKLTIIYIIGIEKRVLRKSSHHHGKLGCPCHFRSKLFHYGTELDYPLNLEPHHK